MDIGFIVTILAIGFIGSFFSGMLGIGGAIINYPILLYIPPLMGLNGFTAHEVSGIVAIQVFVATLGGVWSYRKAGYINKPLLLVMGSSILLGSLIGSYLSRSISENSISIIYGLLALFAGIIMLVPKKGSDHEFADFKRWLASLLAFVVGLASGVVGAGGSFILIPIMLVVLKVPLRITIATSLAITFISSVGGAIGKITTGQVLFLPALLMMAVSLVAAPFGVKISKAMNTKVLQWALAFLILITSVKIWTDILFKL
ncbi:putative membrane protein YfcA [Peribacillus deserti]|uniref:Probable membrane transporter protein n=1 Tax=Peribacillus deserti TaxID=673318 RepID=A0ABS2QK63_9BACI|nr:sulfite exporter TauE/SafE family protein [Peribacillus deserti]MBM7693340.1 putative membrane protein YfcA [Peribacillus deserti]